MAVANLPTLSAVVVTAVIDSINPCAIGVALLLVATMLKQGDRHQMLKVGALYVAAVYFTYFIIGLGVLFFFVNIPVVIANTVTVIVSLFVVGGGILEIKDFFWYGKGTSLMIPARYSHQLEGRMENLSSWAAVTVGIFVAAVEFPCTGGPYLAILTVIANQGVNLTAYALMALYNLIFVGPLIFIIVSAYLGTYSVAEMKQWKHMNRPRMRLAAGVLMVILGWILLILATGIIRFG